MTTSPEPVFGEHRPPLSIEQAAAFLNVEVRWMRRAVFERRLPYYKVGRYLRFRPEDLEEFLARRRIEPRGRLLTADGTAVTRCRRRRVRPRRSRGRPARRSTGRRRRWRWPRPARGTGGRSGPG